MIRWLAFLILTAGCASTAVDSKPHLVSVTSFAQPAEVISPQGSITVLPFNAEMGWDPSTNTDGVVIASYNLYYGTESRFNNDGTWMIGYSNVIPLGDVTDAVAPGLKGATTYYFAVTAVSQDGIESDFSDEITNTIPLVMDVAFQFDQSVTNETLQWSPDLSQWNNLGTIPTNGVWRLTGDSSAARFYRGKATSIP